MERGEPGRFNCSSMGDLMNCQTARMKLLIHWRPKCYVWGILGHDQIEDHSGKRITCPKALIPEIANCYLISARSTILSCHDASPGYNPYVNWRVPPVGFVFLSDNR